MTVGERNLPYPRMPVKIIGIYKGTIRQHGRSPQNHDYEKTFDRNDIGGRPDGMYDKRTD